MVQWMSEKIDCSLDSQSKGWGTGASKETLLERALMLKNIRAFFDARGVIEVETPLLSRFATTDPHLHSLSSSFRGRACYLNTSPEYAMKRLLAGWKQSIYQICKAFRDDELGINHNPEFTLLEWYRPDYDLSQLMDELAALINALLPDSQKQAAFERFSYQQAFEDVADFNPHETTSGECYQIALNNNVEIPQGLTVVDDVDNWLDWLLTQMVIPTFKKDRFTFLYDYPASQCALANIANNAQQVPVAKRFELFFGEVELANGFNELTNAEEQLQRFQQDNQMRKKAGKAPSVIDENFIAALKHGMPECSGVAVGLDRLLMALTNKNTIDKVLSFSWGNN